MRNVLCNCIHIYILPWYHWHKVLTERNKAILEKYKQIVVSNYKEPGMDGSVENEECGVWKMRSVENEEYGKCGVWKMWSVECVEI